MKFCPHAPERCGDEAKALPDKTVKLTSEPKLCFTNVYLLPSKRSFGGVKIKLKFIKNLRAAFALFAAVLVRALFKIKNNLDILFYLINQISRQNSNPSRQPFIVNRSNLINHDVTSFVHIRSPFFKVNSQNVRILFYVCRNWTYNRRWMGNFIK